MLWYSMKSCPSENPTACMISYSISDYVILCGKVFQFSKHIKTDNAIIDIAHFKQTNLKQSTLVTSTTAEAYMSLAIMYW